MTTQNKRISRGLFRTTPEDGAQVAELADALIPGGRGFAQQLLRAKKDVLQGISHLVEAQINELEQIDSAIQDMAQRPPAPPAQAAVSRPAMRGSVFEEAMQKVLDMLLSRKSKSAFRQAIPVSSKPSDERVSPASGSGADGSGPTSPEKISIS
jgi:hypothetical protein